MKRALWAALWLASFLGTGLVAGSMCFERIFLHHHHAWGLRAIAIACLAGGFLAGLGLFLVAASRRFLPGLRPPRAVVDWDWGQAVILIAGFLLMQLAGTVLCTAAITLIVNALGGLQTALAHQPFQMIRPHTILASAIFGYLAASLWTIWYIRRRGKVPLRDGGLTGIGWRPAPRGAYVAAALCALVIVIVVMLFYHFVPPDAHALQNSEMAQVFGRPGWPVFFLVLLAVCVAPPVEELLFRGGIFSALAGRLGPVGAGAVTTLLFMAVHAPEKINYPLGFVDVGLMAAAAAWLRVRYGSIRPGILLHVLYNAGGILAAGVLSYLA